MRLEKQITIERSVDDVFAFLTDMHNVPRWAPVKSVRQVAPGPFRMDVGEQYIQVIEFMNQQVEVMTEITHYAPPSLFGFKTISGPLPLESTFTLTPAGEGTRVDLVSEGDPDSVVKKLGPLVVNVAKKQVDSQLAALKQLLEA